MSNIIDKINAKQINPNIPEFRVGYTVRVDVKIIEGKRERIQAFEGVVVARRGLLMRHLQFVKCLVVLELKELSLYIHQRLLVLQLSVKVKLDVLNLHSLEVWLADTVLKKEDKNKIRPRPYFLFR